jgi:hypothetical protein
VTSRALPGGVLLFAYFALSSCSDDGRTTDDPSGDRLADDAGPFAGDDDTPGGGASDAAVALPASGADAGGTPSASDAASPEEGIGPSGGVLAAADNSVMLVVPAGALDEAIELSLDVIDQPPREALFAVELGPDGTEFEKPVTITVSYEGIELQGIDPARLTLALLEGDEWQPLADSASNLAARTLSANLSHFSIYGVISGPELPPQEEEDGASSPIAECMQNTCGEGCGCDPELAGAACQMGADGMSGCLRCECDGTVFTCDSCEDAAPPVEPEPVPTADAGGTSVNSACEPANSCDQKLLNSSCQEYGAMTPPESVQAVCVGGTYAAQGCDRTDSFGGCQSLSATECLTIWYFAPNFTSVEQVQQQCLNNGRVYVAPDGE